MEVKPLQKPLGRRSVTLGLLAVGATLSSGVMVDRVAPQLVTTVRNLIVMSGPTLVFCLWLALDPVPTAMAVLFMALPHGRHLLCDGPRQPSMRFYDLPTHGDRLCLINA